MENQFFDLEMLKSLAGIVAAVLLIIQFTKNPVDFIFGKICKLLKLQVQKFPTAILVVFVSEILLFTVMYFQNQLDLLNVFLTSINGLVVSAAAMKSFESMVKSNK
jgi:hypothetical protein